MPVVVSTRFSPTAYSKSQLRAAVRVAFWLGRGEFVFLEDPADG